jgi:hypothetical protein
MTPSSRQGKYPSLATVCTSAHALPLSNLPSILLSVAQMRDQVQILQTDGSTLCQCSCIVKSVAELGHHE